jgi:hypothetical protein
MTSTDREHSCAGLQHRRCLDPRGRRSVTVGRASVEARCDRTRPGSDAMVWRADGTHRHLRPPADPRALIAVRDPDHSCGPLQHHRDDCVAKGNLGEPPLLPSLAMLGAHLRHRLSELSSRPIRSQNMMPSFNLCSYWCFHQHFGSASVHGMLNRASARFRESLHFAHLRRRG